LHLQGPDGTGCDICPDGSIIDDNFIVTIHVPSTGDTETATWVEWFGVGCGVVVRGTCPEYPSLAP